MAFGDHQHQVLLEQQPGDQVPTAHRQVEDGQIQLAVGQLRLETRGVSLHDDQPELRMTLGHRVHEAGTSHRAVVPIMPTRTVPVTSSLQAATSDNRASSSDRIRRARATTTVPSSVSRPSARSTEGYQLLLQPGHVGRNVGLHGPEVLGSGRERPVIADRCQRLEVPEFHRF